MVLVMTIRLGHCMVLVMQSGCRIECLCTTLQHLVHLNNGVLEPGTLGLCLLGHVEQFEACLDGLPIVDVCFLQLLLDLLQQLFVLHGARLGLQSHCIAQVQLFHVR